jgi:hypothetical protein
MTSWTLYEAQRWLAKSLELAGCIKEPRDGWLPAEGSHYRILATGVLLVNAGTGGKC